MSEPTPLFDATQAALATDTSPPVDSAVNTTAANTTTDPAPGLALPPGPNLTDLQAFTDTIPDEGHRAIAQHLVDAFTVRDQQLQAFIDAYNTAEGNIAALQTTVADQAATIAQLQSDVAALQSQVAALTPPPAPAP